MNTYKFIKVSILLIFITQLTQFAYASGVRVSWAENSESDVAGYKVYYGTTSRNYQLHVDTGAFTSVEIDGLCSGTSYYFAVTAYDNSGNESAYSLEFQATIPQALTVNAGSGTISVSVPSPVSGTSTSSGSESGGVSSPVTYTLNTSVVNASGTISVAQTTEPYVQGTVVSLTATPDSGYQLLAWTGTDNDNSRINSNTVTMNADRTVLVEFEPVSNAEENKNGGGGGGGGCFISTSLSNEVITQGMSLFILAGIVLLGISGLTSIRINN
jgi:hypothetical protein